MFFCFCLTPQDSLAKDCCITQEKQIQVEDIRHKQVTYSKCSVDDTVHCKNGIEVHCHPVQQILVVIWLFFVFVWHLRIHWQKIVASPKRNRSKWKISGTNRWLTQNVQSMILYIVKMELKYIVILYNKYL